MTHHADDFAGRFYVDALQKGIGRRAPKTPLDIAALVESGALTTQARDGSTSLQARVPLLRLDPPAYPSPTATQGPQT